MANVARLEVSTEWTDLETAIESFTPSADDEFEIQNIGAGVLQVCEAASEPTGNTGFVVPVYKGIKWTKKSGEKCYVSEVNGTTVLNIAEK